jgi:hypothetical protein
MGRHISIILGLIPGIIQNVVRHSYVRSSIYICSDTYRELKVYLNCDKLAKTPFVTTEGDSRVVLSYVSKRMAKI